MGVNEKCSISSEPQNGLDFSLILLYGDLNFVKFF